MRVDGVLADLTSRERRICVLAGKGLTTAAIASKLRVDVKTIESHRTSAYRKLGVRTLAELKRLLTLRGSRGQRTRISGFVTEK